MSDLKMMNQLLLTDKQFRILKFVEEAGYILAVSKKSDVSYSHVYKLMLNFEFRGIVKLEKTVQRKRMVRLTEKGTKVLELYFQVYNLLKGGVK